VVQAVLSKIHPPNEVKEILTYIDSK
jgi:hypothetical protein